MIDALIADLLLIFLKVLIINNILMYDEMMDCGLFLLHAITESKGMTKTLD